MGLRLDDRWIWDFWFATDRDTYHVFYLQASRSLGDPDARHWNVSIGHAVSRDLWRWEPVDDALAPAGRGAWDDFTTWTGSVVPFGDRWAMLYTGGCHVEDGKVQRVGVARSDDLSHWERSDRPVLEADPRYYEVLDGSPWYEQAWRDPWAFFDPDDGHLHVFVTARAPVGEADGRGVIGHARSRDLVSWEVLPPVTEPIGFGHLEVPQLVSLDDRWYLLFCSDTETQSPARRRLGAGTGTYYLVADDRYGPYRMIGDGALEADPAGSTYAGRIHRSGDGTPWFLAWNRAAPDGSFLGELGDPRRVHVAPDGSLRLERVPLP
jgi:beta-fructofuranosidase